jgi:hypothetical protein
MSSFVPIACGYSLARTLDFILLYGILDLRPEEATAVGSLVVYLQRTDNYRATETGYLPLPSPGKGGKLGHDLLFDALVILAWLWFGLLWIPGATEQ